MIKLSEIASSVIDRWTDPEHIRSGIGDLTPSECKAAVIAVTKYGEHLGYALNAISARHPDLDARQVCELMIREQRFLMDPERALISEVRSATGRWLDFSTIQSLLNRVRTDFTNAIREETADTAEF